jgi:hypothetical protein
MRRVLGSTLIAVGAFLVVLAVLAQFYASGRVMKTPLDTNSTTRLSGEATLYSGGTGTTFPAKAVSITRADSAKSDGKVIVFANSTCLVRDQGSVADCVSSDDPQNRLVSASTDNFATDRHTAEAVNDPKYLPAGAARHEGLINKFPFETRKKTYSFWNSTTDTLNKATATGQKTIRGLKTYAFTVRVQDAPMQIADGVPGTFSSVKTMWVEPLTGAIIDQTEHQTRATTDGAPVLDLDLRFTPQTVAHNVDTARSNVTKLKLVSNVLPLVGYVVGIPLLLVGLLLLLRGQRTPR